MATALAWLLSHIKHHSCIMTATVGCCCFHSSNRTKLMREWSFDWMLCLCCYWLVSSDVHTNSIHSILFDCCDLFGWVYRSPNRRARLMPFGFLQCWLTRVGKRIRPEDTMRDTRVRPNRQMHPILIWPTQRSLAIMWLWLVSSDDLSNWNAKYKIWAIKR